MNLTQSERVRSPKYVLEPAPRSYRICRLVEDRDFDPPMWVAAGYLNGGRTFKTRDEARDYMRSEVER